MARIRNRKGRYTAEVRKPGFRPVCRTFRTKKDAMRWSREVECAMDRRDYRTIEPHRLNEAIERFKQVRELGTHASNVLAWWAEQLGERNLTALRRTDFLDAREILKARTTKNQCLIKPATVNRRVHAISAVLTYAMELEWLERNPARISALPENNERSDEEALLSDADMNRLLKACRASREPHLYPFVVTAIVSGARAGELLALRWRDVDLDRGIAFVRRSKNGTKRPIAIRGEAERALRAVFKTRPVYRLDGSDAVFLNRTGSAPFKYREVWGIAKRAADITNYRFHDLRHLCASIMAMAGVTQTEVMKILGHKSASMTMRYSHLFDAHVSAVGALVSERVFADV